MKSGLKFKHRVTRGALRLLVGVLFVSGVLMYPAVPAFADSTLCSGAWSSCTSAGYTDHGYGANSGNQYWHSFSGHNCTNYVAYAQIQSGFSSQNAYNPGNAVYWKNYFTSRGFAYNGSPAIGAVAWWNANYHGSSSDGHVAYVEGYDAATNTIKVSEDNYPSGPFRWREISLGGSSSPSGFIHLNDLASSTTVGAVQNNNGTWQWKLRNSNSSGSTNYDFGYGTSDMTPVTGDWDGNGTTTVGVVQNNNGTLQWKLRNANSSGSTNYDFGYGTSSMVPVTGDWDGNGTTTIGAVQNNNGTWQWKLRNSNSSGSTNYDFGYGTSDMTPVTGDWDAV